MNEPLMLSMNYLLGNLLHNILPLLQLPVWHLTMHIKVFLWSFATILVALLLYQTFVSMKAYFLKPTFATSVFLDQKDANLPDTTFCALSGSFVSLDKESNPRSSWFRIPRQIGFV